MKLTRKQRRLMTSDLSTLAYEAGGLAGSTSGLINLLSDDRPVEWQEVHEWLAGINRRVVDIRDQYMSDVLDTSESLLDGEG